MMENTTISASDMQMLKYFAITFLVILAIVIILGIVRTVQRFMMMSMLHRIVSLVGLTISTGLFVFMCFKTYHSVTTSFQFIIDIWNKLNSFA